MISVSALNTRGERLGRAIEIMSGSTEILIWQYGICVSTYMMDTSCTKRNRQVNYRLYLYPPLSPTIPLQPPSNLKGPYTPLLQDPSTHIIPHEQILAISFDPRIPTRKTHRRDPLRLLNRVAAIPGLDEVILAAIR